MILLLFTRRTQCEQTHSRSEDRRVGQRTRHHQYGLSQRTNGCEPFYHARRQGSVPARDFLSGL